MPRPSAAPLPRRARAAVALLTALVLAVGLGAVAAAPAQAAPPVPPTPAGLTAAIEAAQPYVGQNTCDPVAKPGVSAFRDLLLRTYPDSGSFGIVRDCGTGGQSEHKEGRAFDWAMSVGNAQQVAEVNALLSWLFATDKYGNTFAIAKRLGLMYLIWDKRIWGAYNNGTWKAYTGDNPHTDHVHFSFGWNGAKKATSYWSGTVAPIDYGPTAQPAAPVITPVRTPGNLRVLREYGRLPLTRGSSGEAVATLQRALRITADGAYGSQTAAAVSDFQRQQSLPVSGDWSRPDWERLFPAPIDPFGQLNDVRTSFATTEVTGWVVDADTSSPVSVALTVDGAPAGTRVADVSRPDVGASYPDTGAAHGFAVPLSLSDGTHTICVTGLNHPGSPGVDTWLGCRTLTVRTGAVGANDSVSQVLGDTRITGWALDTSTASPISVQLSVDGALTRTVTANSPRPDIGAQWPAYGGNHGFSADLTLPEGNHTVCATALRAGGAGSVPLGCRSLAVIHRPLGGFDGIYQGPAGTYARGWSVDLDSTRPVNIVLSLDGRRIRQFAANLPHADVAAAFPANGANHGWSTLWTVPEGTHQVCAFAGNIAGTPGTEMALGCRTVVVRHSTIGGYEAIKAATGVLEARGWAIDPDISGPIAVWGYVDGQPIRSAVAYRPRGDVSAAWPGYGEGHGWVLTIPASAGPHQVCVTAINASWTPGDRTSLGCRPITVQ